LTGNLLYTNQHEKGY